MQKINNHHYVFISSQNGTGQAESDTKNKKSSFRSIPTQSEIKISQKIAKQSKNLKNIIMDSFQAKTARHRPRMIYKKKISFGSIPTRSGIGNSKKNSKKIQKTKKNHYGFFSSQNGMGQAENERRKKIIVPIHSNPTRNREFQQNSKKKTKN